MRMWSSVLVVGILVSGVACSSRSDPPSTPAAGQAQSGGAAQAAPAPAPAPPRITPEQVEAAMKGIQQNMGATQKALKGNMLMEAAASAKQLATLFADVERFFQQNN